MFILIRECVNDSWLIYEINIFFLITNAIYNTFNTSHKNFG